MGSVPQSSRRRAVASTSGGITTALIYTRVSSDDQRREGVSLEAQLAACREYAARQGWVIGREYQDVMTGKRDDRPEYQQLLADVRALRAEGRAVVVLVSRLDRFGRRLRERVRSREEFKALGATIHSIREGGEVNDMVAGILAVIAEDEVTRLSERISDAKQHIIGSGFYGGGLVPWGYRLRDATAAERRQGAPLHVLDLDPATVPFVQEAWARRAAGASVSGITVWVAGLPDEARGGRTL